MFGAEDCIEHYCRCPASLEVLHKMFRIELSPQRALSFWMLDCPGDDATLISCALNTYAAYNAFNMYSHSGKKVQVPEAVDAMREFILQAVSGSQELRSFLDNRWAEPIFRLC